MTFMFSSSSPIHVLRKGTGGGGDLRKPRDTDSQSCSKQYVTYHVNAPGVNPGTQHRQEHTLNQVIIQQQKPQLRYFKWFGPAFLPACLLTMTFILNFVSVCVTVCEGRKQRTLSLLCRFFPNFMIPWFPVWIWVRIWIWIWIWIWGEGKYPTKV